MITLIALNIVGIVLQTVPALNTAFRPQFVAFEIFSVLAFTAEYLLRVWASPASSRYQGSVMGRIRFILSPMGLVDLFAVLPFWLPFVGVDLRFLRALRLLRIFRVFKLQRYSRALQMIGRVAAATRPQMAVSFSVVVILLLVSSSLMYLVEHEAQPEVFSSIPASMWWAVATLTTVGYGDVYPITPIGRLLGSVVAILGIGMFALPTSILGAAFVDELRGAESTGAQLVTCPHCGREHGVQR